jgi:hypothetical protein
MRSGASILRAGISNFGGRKVKTEKQLTEVLDIRMAQRHVILLARYWDNNQPIMLKIRYQYVKYNLRQYSNSVVY